jgi:hypothetical protein
MLDLDFAVAGVEPELHAAAPLLVFKLRVRNAAPEIPVQNVMLNCQIRIDAVRRRYGPQDHERLVELFGAPERWSQTLQSLLWAHASVTTPPFAADCEVALPVPCSYDFNVAATKYFYGLADGEVPLLLLFSGTVFYRDAEDRLQIGQIAHTKEAAYRLPVQVWQRMMDHYYPKSAWLRLDRAVFDRIYRYKRENGLTSWEHALEHLLDARAAEARP